MELVKKLFCFPCSFSLCHERSACVSTKENNIFKVKLQIKFPGVTLIHKML